MVVKEGEESGILASATGSPVVPSYVVRTVKLVSSL